MKVAILTITNGQNYGNRLQNYASQEVLKSLGFEVETIKNLTNQKRNSTNKQKLKKVITNIYDFIGIKNIKTLNRGMRTKRFDEFTNTYINQSKYIIASDDVPENINKEYDFFICGSDQIWNPDFFFNSEIDFLTFADKGKRVAYSASFGVSEIPEDRVNEYKEWINGMDYLSVREKAGSDIIKNLTGRDSLVLVDPTLMLTKEKWLSISKKPKLKINDKFILTYFLGEKSEETKNKINKIAQDSNLQVIDLLDMSNKYNYSIDPSEFIYLINSCTLMCTDSFHGAVFSIIMNTPFIVFERKSKGKSMNSRIDTLLSLFSMESRLGKNVTDDNIFNVDFSHVTDILDRERNRAINYLKQATKLD